MILYGWTTQHKTIGTQEFHCPRCNARRKGDIVSQEGWFTLFFLPLVPLRSQGEYVECRTCRTTFKKAVLHYDPRADEPAKPVDKPAKPVADSGGYGLATAEAAAPRTAARASPPLPDPVALYADPQASERIMSPGAGLSLLLGVAALALAFVSWFSVLVGLATILAGHLGQAAVRSDPKRIAGAKEAAVGLTMGYGSLALRVIFVMVLKMVDGAPPPVLTGSVTPQQTALNNAEQMLVRDVNSGVTAFGNTPEAKRIAEEFGADMESFDQRIIGKDLDRSKITGRYRTWCELHSGSCAFLFYVPDANDLDKDIKALLEGMAWERATHYAKSKLKVKDRLAIEMRGDDRFEVVATGSFADATTALREKYDRSGLLAYFPAVSVPTASHPSLPTSGVASSRGRTAVKNEEDVRFALEDLRQGDSNSRGNAIERLSQASAPFGPRDEVAAALLAIALRGDNEAIRALTVWGDVDVVGKLMASDLDSNTTNREAIYKLVAKFGGAEHADALIKDLDKLWYRPAALKALAPYGAEAEPKLLVMLNSGIVRRQEIALEALAAVGTSAALPELREFHKLNKKKSVFGSMSERAIRNIEQRAKL